MSTSWWWEEAQRKVEKRRYSRNSCYYEKRKRSKVVYLKIQIQWILFYGKLENWNWTLRRGHTMKFSGCIWYETKIRERIGQSGGVVQKGDLREPHDKQIAPAKQRRIWREKFTERKIGECFQRKTIGSCSRRDTCSFLHTHATGDREDNVGWSGETQEDLAWRKHPLQYRKWRNRLTWTACAVQRLVMWLQLKNPLCMAGKMKKIVAQLSTSSRVSWLQVWKQMHSWLSLPMSTSWWWEEAQRKVEERKYSRSSCYYEKKKRSKVVYLKIQIQLILFYGKLENWDWTLRRDTPWNSQDASGTKLKFGKEQGNLEALSKKETWENLTTSRLYQQSSVEFGEKNMQAQSRS